MFRQRLITKTAIKNTGIELADIILD